MQFIFVLSFLTNCVKRTQIPYCGFVIGKPFVQYLKKKNTIIIDVLCLPLLSMFVGDFEQDFIIQI
jgi:hypothetical protein